MKTLKNNKLLAWMLALITAVCAFLGVMLTTPLNTALADDTAQQITNETFPDTSTWEEKAFPNIEETPEFLQSISGKIIRINYGKAEQTVLNVYLAGEDGEGIMFSFSYDPASGLAFCDTTGGDFAYKAGDGIIEVVLYPNAGIYLTNALLEIEGSSLNFEEYATILVEPTEQTPDETPDETPDVEDEGKWSDKTADWLNENLGLTLTGSVVSVVVVVLVVYFLFFRKRR